MPMTLLEFYESKRPRSYETNWHHRWTCDILERAYTERRNAIIEIPPRHGKSEIVNVYGPAWRFEDHFDAMFGLVCNSDALAKKFSTAARGFVTHPLEIDRDAQWKIKGLESLNFSYMAAGIRGQLTGHGFDTAIFDDLLKSGAEAKSDVVRDSVWDGVVSAAINRLTPDGIIVALQARLHQQDTIGKLLELEHLKFLHLHLPATNDDGQSAWFRDGYSGEEVVFPAYRALWPTRYSREHLDAIRATIHSYYWSAQYQQVPSMGDLSYFDVNVMPSYQYPTVERCWLAVDAANTENVKGSYTAFVALGMEKGRLKVFNVARGRWRQDVMRTQLLEFYGAVARQNGIIPEKVIVERAAGGFGIIDSLSGQLPIEPVYPLGSKEARAGAVCYVVNRGQVALPQAAPWLEAFRSELQNFPLGSTKDLVDAFVHALSYATRPSEFRPKPMSQVVVQDLIEEDFGCELLRDFDAGLKGLI
jgi:predicted phage terminase large subunit-like protein